MQLELIDKFKNLPEVLINHIINYTDVLVYRHGKYINRFKKSDKRYKIIQSVPKPIKIGKSMILIKLLNIDKKGYFLEYIINIYIKLNVKFVSYEVDGFDRYLETKSFLQLIYDKNSKWSKLIHYSM
jgi:hypothetical protein